MLERDIEVVKTAIEDVRCTVEEIGDLYGMNLLAVFYISKEVLKLKKVCARWFPHLLMSEQKGVRDPRRLKEIVIGDETWLYFF